MLDQIASFSPQRGIEPIDSDSRAFRKLGHSFLFNSDEKHCFDPSKYRLDEMCDGVVGQSIARNPMNLVEVGAFYPRSKNSATCVCTASKELPSIFDVFQKML